MRTHRPTLAWSATLAAASAATFLVRSWSLRFGATADERTAPLPGDGIVPTADLTSTRAVTIAASADQVWPWVVQMGQGRGGLYSYDALENLVGCAMHSADRVLPEFQQLVVGDEFRLHPDVALQVALVEPGHALVLSGGVPMGEAAPPYDFSWAFVLRGTPEGRTRLLVRERYGYTQWWSPLLVEPVEMVSFVMSQRMLRGIRDRAERAAA
jgi:hypothetical protein